MFTAGPEAGINTREIKLSMTELAYGDLLASINEAALDPHHWVAVLRQLANLTGCIAGGLTVENADTKEGDPIAYFGFDPDHVVRSWHYYLPTNPLFRIVPLLQPGAIITNGMAMPIADFIRTEFYNGWSRPQGIGCPVTLVLHRRGPQYISLTLVRPDREGDIDPMAIRLLSRVAPSLRRAFSVTMRLERLTNREAAFEQTLARLAFGIILLDHGGRITFANPAAEALLRDGRMIASHQGGIKGQRGCDIPLQAAIAGALTSSVQPGIATVVLKAEGESPMTLFVMPASRRHGKTVVAGEVGCIVILGTQGSTGPDTATLAQSYSLTRAETRVLGALLAGHDLAASATALAISRNTVNTHVRSMFIKMGVARQVDLMRVAWAEHLPLLR